MVVTPSRFFLTYTQILLGKQNLDWIIIFSCYKCKQARMLANIELMAAQNLDQKTQPETERTMKIGHIQKATVVASLLLGAISLQAADNPWTGNGADHDWANPANWTSNPSLPATGTGTTGDILDLDTVAPNNYAIYTAAQGTLTYQTIRVGYYADGRLDVTGGTLIGDGSSVQTRIGRGGHTGTLNIAGGTFMPGSIMQVGIDANSVGIVNVSSGTLNATRGATQDGIANTSIALGAGNTGSGTLNLSGGNLYTRFGVEVGQSSLAGSGLFNVMGGGLAQLGTANGANPTSAGFWYQRGNGTLAATVDSAGFTLGAIQIVNGSAGGSYVTFDSGSTLSLGFNGATPTTAMSWDLMTWDDNTTLTDNGLTLAPGDTAAGWSFGFVDTGGTSAPNALQITFTPVPEPSAFVLGGCGLAALLVFRRRK